MYRLEPVSTLERCRVEAKEVTQDCMTLSEKPDAVLVNYNNRGYARVRFDEASKACLLNNLRYVTDTAMRTYIWRTFKDMVQVNHLSIKDWFRLISNNLEFETEEQTLEVVLDQVLKTFGHGLFTEEQITAIFNTVSKMEHQIRDEKGASKSALINSFCSSIVSTGIIIDPSEFTP